jgi:divalent metal cation (Fe/Co/Zn/Cd) transporter
MTPERRATAIAMATAGALAITKFTIGLLSGSMAVLASATDSLGDLFVSFINFLAVGKSVDPEDSNHNYGHGKIEGFAALFE